MSTPEGQPSDSHIHLDPAIQAQDSANAHVATGFNACERALSLLGNLQRRQAGLPRSPALAWERAAFAEAFDHPEPGRRIRRFLDKDLK
jgi:hypothetical protein